MIEYDVESAYPTVMSDMHRGSWMHHYARGDVTLLFPSVEEVYEFVLRFAVEEDRGT